MEVKKAAISVPTYPSLEYVRSVTGTWPRYPERLDREFPSQWYPGEVVLKIIRDELQQLRTMCTDEQKTLHGVMYWVTQRWYNNIPYHKIPWWYIHMMSAIPTGRKYNIIGLIDTLLSILPLTNIPWTRPSGFPTVLHVARLMYGQRPSVIVEWYICSHQHLCNAGDDQIRATITGELNILRPMIQGKSLPAKAFAERMLMWILNRWYRVIKPADCPHWYGLITDINGRKLRGDPGEMIDEMLAALS